jgi:hypothetical protein
VSRSIIFVLAVAAAAVAAVPVVSYPFVRRESWLNPYENRFARWTVYVGGGLALALFIVLSSSG